LFACAEHEETAVFTREVWKVDNYLDSTQILLTNEYAFQGSSFGSGANSFLIDAGEDTLLCTAKHLLGQAMGIFPEIKTSDFNSKLNYWKAFPRTDQISSDTIEGKTVANKAQSSADILLQKCSSVKSNIQVLKPRFTTIKPNEKLEIIACELNDSTCHQKSYEVVLDEYNKGSIIVTTKEKFSPRGMSGAPVIDKNGYVVGVLVGGSPFKGQLYLSVELLTKVRTYLK